MKTSKIKKPALFAILMLTSCVALAQLSVPFKVRYQFQVKGDMALIANNIVNRVDYNNSSNEPYYNHTNYAKLNDEFDMDYIDIDDDESTFSSSSAELFYDKPSNKKILYAGLYWSATYKYNSGIQKNEEKFIASDPKRESFSNIKIKLPNEKNYQDISGQIIFDGLKEYKDNAPYVAYADITSYVKSLNNPTGVYTVANIKSTLGKISGGAAAGWTIFIVYEDKTMSEKSITTYDGFAGITDKSVDIVFNGFATPSTGNVKEKIACTTLEGDLNQIGDQLLFTTKENKIFTPLNTSIRNANNFFNSAITIDDQYFINRFPDSKNTLGYDAFSLNIPNPNNTFIGNNSKESILRFKSTGDKYFVFFTALNVEVNSSTETILENKIIATSHSEKPSLTKEIIKNKTIKYIPSNNDFLVFDYNGTSTFNKVNKKVSVDNNFIEIQSLYSSSQPSGYYLIANIFKTEQQAQEFTYYLKTRKIKSEIFTNSLNNYKYVFLKKVDNEKEAVDLFLSKFNDTYEERLLILQVKNENNSPIVQLEKEVKKPTDASQISTLAQSSPLSIKPQKAVTAKASNDFQIANIPNEPKGYYIVANVFSVNENSTNFMKSLKARGLDPKIIVNTLNNYKYVYLKKVENEDEARNLLLSKMNNTYQSKLWVLSVNNTSLVTENE